MEESGLTAEAAQEQAIEALGDPQAARKFFRRIHLTKFQSWIVKQVSVELDEEKQKANHRRRIVLCVMSVVYILLNIIDHWMGRGDWLELSFSLILIFMAFHPATFNCFPVRAGLIIDMVFWPLLIFALGIPMRLLLVDMFLDLGPILWHFPLAIWGIAQIIFLWIYIPIYLKLITKKMAQMESSPKDPDSYA